MALSVEDLAIELRIIGDPDDTLDPAISGVIQRLHLLASDMVERTAPAAPEGTKDVCVAMIAGYLYDRPSSPSGAGWANALHNSGAAHVLTRWVSRRALPIGGETAAASAKQTFGARLGWSADGTFSADELGPLGTAGTGTVTLQASPLAAGFLGLWVSGDVPRALRLSSIDAPGVNLLSLFREPIAFADESGTAGRLWVSKFEWRPDSTASSYVVVFP